MCHVTLWRQESGEWVPFGVRKRVGPGRMRIQSAETNGASHVSRGGGDTSIRCFSEARRRRSQNPPLLEATQAALQKSIPADPDSQRGIMMWLLLPSAPSSPLSFAYGQSLPKGEGPMQEQVEQMLGIFWRASPMVAHGRTVVRDLLLSIITAPLCESRACSRPRHSLAYVRSGVSSSRRSLNQQEVQVQERQLPRTSPRYV